MKEEEEEIKEIPDEFAKDMEIALTLDSPEHFERTLKKIIAKETGRPESEINIDLDLAKWSSDNLCVMCLFDNKTCDNEDAHGSDHVFICDWYEKRG